MEITLEQLSHMPCSEYVYVDVRDEIAYGHGHITGAIWWDGSDDRIKILPADKKLILYCSYGEKSVPLTERLRQQGYDAYNLSGGYREWLLDSFDELTASEVARYDR